MRVFSNTGVRRGRILGRLGGDALTAATPVGRALGYGLLAIWAANALFRIALAGLFAWSRERGRWALVRV